MNSLEEDIKKILENKGFSVDNGDSILFKGIPLDVDELVPFQTVTRAIGEGMGINFENRFFEITKKIKGSGLEKMKQLVEMARST
jgi:hypothetical protein